MPHLQLKNISEEVHSELRRRATAAGMSMRDYVLRLIEADQLRSPMDEWLDELEAHWRGMRGATPGESAAGIIRSGREERDAHLQEVWRRMGEKDPS